MHRTILAGLVAATLLSACGGGGSAGGAPAQAAATTVAYRFVPPKAGAHLVYADQQADTLNNTLNRNFACSRISQWL